MPTDTEIILHCKSISTVDGTRMIVLDMPNGGWIQFTMTEEDDNYDAYEVDSEYKFVGPRPTDPHP